MGRDRTGRACEQAKVTQARFAARVLSVQGRAGGCLRHLRTQAVQAIQRRLVQHRGKLCISEAKPRGVAQLEYNSPPYRKWVPPLRLSCACVCARAHSSAALVGIHPHLGAAKRGESALAAAAEADGRLAAVHRSHRMPQLRQLLPQAGCAAPKVQQPLWWRHLRPAARLSRAQQLRRSFAHKPVHLQRLPEGAGVRAHQAFVPTKALNEKVINDNNMILYIELSPYCNSCTE